MIGFSTMRTRLEVAGLVLLDETILGFSLSDSEEVLAWIAALRRGELCVRPRCIPMPLVSETHPDVIHSDGRHLLIDCPCDRVHEAIVANPSFRWGAVGSGEAMLRLDYECRCFLVRADASLIEMAEDRWTLLPNIEFHFARNPVLPYREPRSRAMCSVVPVVGQERGIR